MSDKIQVNPKWTEKVSVQIVRLRYTPFGQMGARLAVVIACGRGEGSPSLDGPAAVPPKPPTGETRATRSINPSSDFCAIYFGHR